MLERVVQGVSVPALMYGTAWKEARTTELTTQALAAGFRAIDTANQRKHYFEAAVGDAVASTIAKGSVSRADLFLQTKFTHIGGQDQRLPYDPKADIETQVWQSFDSSLEHLHTSYLDSYVLHGPSSHRGLTKADWAAWRAMEGLHAAGRTRLIGMSNVSLDQLRALYDGATIKPAFVQNRCYASEGWNREVRALCAEKAIVYQGFSLLTANQAVVGSALVERIALRIGRSPAQVIFRFALQVGMVVLTGTSSRSHLQEDLTCLEFELADSDVLAIEGAAV